MSAAPLATLPHLGVCGGGQLGLMLARAASRLGIADRMHILDAAPDAPAKRVLAATPHVDAGFDSPQGVEQLARLASILTVEIEHVDVDALDAVARDGLATVEPHPSTLRIIQDKYRQKEFLRFHGVPVMDFALAIPENVEELLQELSLPLVLKARRWSYDGRGNRVAHTRAEVLQSLAELSHGKPEAVYAEAFAPFLKELSCIVVRARDGQVAAYPVVETVHHRAVLHLTLTPVLDVEPALLEEAKRVAMRAVAAFEGAGVFGVEMFLLPEAAAAPMPSSASSSDALVHPRVVVNEIAPRPHNTGHYTIEACHTSQFENHLRAVLGLPLGSCELKVPAAVMLNLLGADGYAAACDQALTMPGAALHVYGKGFRAGRKLGHVTITGASLDACMASARTLTSTLDATLPMPRTPAAQPRVGVIMGSDSDLPTMRAAAEVLASFHVPFEVTIVSAHRTPQRLCEYAQKAASRGLQVIIAGAGGAAHLPGMVASMTPLPVIGVPVVGRVLDGQDALMSIVQMPRGVPVACVAIGNATNAGLLAVRMLAANDPVLRDAMLRYQANMEAQVHSKAERMASMGWEAYAQAMP